MRLRHSQSADRSEPLQNKLGQSFGLLGQHGVGRAGDADPVKMGSLQRYISVTHKIRVQKLVD